MAHYDIYREQLAALYHGHALWEPDPAGLYDQVAVGDAGYIRQGHFHKLFNILLPADDPSHDLLGVPDGFEPLQIGSTHLRILALPKGDYHSFSVTASDVAVGAQIAAGTVPVTGSFQVSFSCSKKQGAVLSLPFDARREDTFRKGDFRAYIVAHCEQWLTFAQHHGLDVERMEELILVTGCDRTQPWALAAFNSTSMSAGIAFDVSVLSGAASAPTLKWKIVQQDGQSTPYNYGPRPEQEPRSNQCVFIRGYRAKKRPIQRLPVKILAAAEPRPDDDGRGDDGKDASEVEAEDISDFPVYHDPLLPILDFLLDECPQAETVVVHDDDLMHIVGQDVLSADVVRTYLHDVAKTSPSRSCPGGLTVELSDILGDIPARANPTSGSLPFPPRPRRSIMHRRNVSAPTPLYIEPSKNRAPALQKPRKQPPQPAAPGAGHPHSPSSHTPQLTSSSGSLRRTPAKAIPRSLPPVPSDRPATPTYGSICGDAPPPYGPTTPLSSIREAGQRPKGPRSRLPRMAHNILHRTHMYDDNAIQDSLGLLESPDPPTSIFITEPIALKGLTLEAARWTFPPEHMQAVVSKAVRQSADTSSLRLLPPAVINGELPEALLHLDARQRALKEEHILRSRRRDTLFASLLSGHGANADTLKEQMEELQAVSEDIDRTAAELFRLLDQVAQLRQLAETHSRSALALALRILNASALHSSTEAQTLRSKVATQEAVVHEILGPQVQSTQGGSRVSPITPTSVPPAWKPRRRGSWST